MRHSVIEKKKKIKACSNQFKSGFNSTLIDQFVDDCKNGKEKLLSPKQRSLYNLKT